MALPIEQVVFDVDDVLVIMERATRLAEESVVEALAPEIGDERARGAYSGFVSRYGILREQLRQRPGVVLEDYAALRKRIDGWQAGVVSQGFEVKQWSRDVLLAIALEDLGVAPTSRLVGGAIDHYWDVMAEATTVYPDALALIAELRARGIPFHLATNSDGFLRLDDQRRTFVYDPSEAAERKVRRCRVLMTEAKLAREDVTVGDPLGKPHAAFYERVLLDFSKKLGRPIDRARTLAVGDSLTMDVLPLLAIGVGRGAWLDRTRTPPHREPHPDRPDVPVIASLGDLWPVLWP